MELGRIDGASGSQFACFGALSGADSLIFFGDGLEKAEGWRGLSTPPGDGDLSRRLSWLRRAHF